MDKEELQSVYNTLSRYRSEYYASSGKAQLRIEKSVRLCGDRIPGDLYCKVIRVAQVDCLGLLSSKEI